MGTAGRVRPVASKKQTILETTARLFVARGYHGTTMDDVASTVGLNKGTLYHYYSSKSALLRDIYMTTVDALADITGDQGHEDHEDPEAEFRRLVHDVLEVITTNITFTTVYFQEGPFLGEWLTARDVAAIRAREAAFTANLEDIIVAGVRSGAFVDIPPKLATLAAIGMVGWVYRWYRSDGRYQAHEIADTYLSIFLNGARPRAEAAPTNGATW